MEPWRLLEPCHYRLISRFVGITAEETFQRVAPMGNQSLTRPRSTQAPSPLPPSPSSPSPPSAMGSIGSFGGPFRCSSFATFSLTFATLARAGIVGLLHRVAPFNRVARHVTAATRHSQQARGCEEDGNTCRPQSAQGLADLAFRHVSRKSDGWYWESRDVLQQLQQRLQTALKPKTFF